MKDANPGCYDLSVGGVFAPDESHHLNAERELHEELNLLTKGDDFTFTYCGCRPYSNQYTSHYAYIFVMNVYDDRVFKAMQLQKSEVNSVEWWSADEIEQKWAE